MSTAPPGAGGGAAGPGDRLALAFGVLEVVAQRRTGISANELARELGVPRSTMYRTVNSLVQQEFLLRRPDLTGFILGVRVTELAQVVAELAPSRESLIVAGLRQETGAALHLVGFRGEVIEILDEDPARPVSDPRALAAQPARSAVGHLLLADLPPERSAQIAGVPAAEVRGLAESGDVRGYAQQIGLLTPDRACLAVPIRRGAALVGAIALSADPAGISTAARHVARLRETAERLSGLWTSVRAGPEGATPRHR